MAATLLGVSAAQTGTATLASPFAAAYALPNGTDNRLIVVVFIASRGAQGSGDPTGFAVTYGGVAMTVKGIENPEQFTIGIATVSASGNAFADDSIVVDVAGTLLNGTFQIAVQAIVFDNIQPGDANQSFASASNAGGVTALSLAPMNVPSAGDLIFSFAGSAVSSLTQANAGFSMGSLFANGDNKDARIAYSAIVAGNVTVEWTQALAVALSALGFVARAACVDDFNCACEVVSGYQTLAELRRRMLIRGGYAAVADNPPPGVVTLIDEFLQGAQNLLYRQHSELRTERFYKWTMGAGQRFYGILDSENCCAKTLDAYKVTWVGFEDLGGAWYELAQGISPSLYTQVNTHTGFPCRYEIRSCIEIFPAPQAAYTLWVKGHFGLDPFTAAGDRTTIDSEAVFLLALGRLKQDRGKPDAAAVLKDADTYVQGLVSGSHHTARYVPRGFGMARSASMTRPLFLPAA